MAIKWGSWSESTITGFFQPQAETVEVAGPLWVTDCFGTVRGGEMPQGSNWETGVLAQTFIIKRPVLSGNGNQIGDVERFRAVEEGGRSIVTFESQL